MNVNKFIGVRSSTDSHFSIFFFSFFKIKVLVMVWYRKNHECYWLDNLVIELLEWMNDEKINECKHFFIN